MATTSSYGSGATAVTSWTNTANAYDASATTYANPVGAVTTHVLDITGYNFAATVPADAVGITSVVVNVQDYVSATNRFTAPTVRAYDGVTALGSSAFTLTQRSAAGSENATLAGSFTVAAVRSAGFKITYSLPQTSTAGSPVAYFGWANVTVNYTVLVNQAVTAASVTSTGVLTNRRILPKILTSTTAATATVRRAVSRTLLDTVAATSTTTKRVSKTILDSVTTTATRSTGSIILRDLNDVVSTTATLTRSVSKTLTDSVTSTPSISTWKFTSKLLTATSVSLSGTLKRTAGKRVDSTVQIDASLPGKWTGLIKAVVVPVTPSVQKFSAKSISDSVLSTGVLVKSHVFPRVLEASASATATTRRIAKKNVSKTVTTAVTLRRKTSMTITDVVNPKAKFAFQFAWKKTMAVTVTSTSSVRKFIRTTKSDTVTTYVSFLKFAKRKIVALNHPEATFGFRQSLKRTLQYSTTTRARMPLLTSKRLPVVVSATPSVRKMIRKTATATPSILGSVARLFIQGTGWIQWNGPTQQPTPLELLGMWDGAQIVPLEWNGEEVN